ncbi:MAG: hypothetical protein RQ751_07380 [Longimicrobiales bacterium]|nr:hypothetical protein [Longimicrobiales bacterium]
MTVRALARLPFLALLLAAAGCNSPGSTDGGGAGALVAVRDTVGDTVVVRTVSGSVWGEDAVLVPEVEIGVLDGDERYMFGRIRALAVGAGFETVEEFTDVESLFSVFVLRAC